MLTLVNTEARSHNNCRGKEISITYLSVCVCVCVCERVWVAGLMGVYMRVRACSLVYPA